MTQEKKKSVRYTNPAMPEYIKIGRTFREDVEQRLKELSNPSGVPLPFECRYAAEVADATKVEQALHDAFECDRINPKREFFKTDPQRIITLLKAHEIANVTPSAQKMLDEITSPEDKEAQSNAIAKGKWDEMTWDELVNSIRVQAFKEKVTSSPPNTKTNIETLRLLVNQQWGKDGTYPNKGRCAACLNKHFFATQKNELFHSPLLLFRTYLCLSDDIDIFPPLGTAWTKKGVFCSAVIVPRL